MENQNSKFYSLPALKYPYSALAPYVSEEQLRIHHDGHHLSYVEKANSILENLDKARGENSELDMKAVLKELSFNIGGHVLHTIFWEGMDSEQNLGGKDPEGKLHDVLQGEFGSIERFKKEFSETALSVEGSGWAVLAFCKKTQRPLLMQIEKHNMNIYPGFSILLVLDMWEHAYYLDYKNEKKKFVESFWKIVNFKKAEERLENLLF